MILVFQRFLIAALVVFSTVCAVAETTKLNVLFIAVDDLRPELGCYGAPQARSPNIDALASRGMVFNRAYCQYPLCNPSRVSILTGLRPDTTKVYDLKKSLRETNPDFVTLPQLFKENGYHTRSIGKIFHGIQGLMGDPESWSEPPVAGKDVASTADGSPRQPHGLPYEAPDVDDDKLPDGDVARMTIDALRANADRPFFLAVGFAKPHLPFVAPKKYWERFDTTTVSLPSNAKSPEGAPDYASNRSGELRQYIGIPKQGSIPIHEQIRLKAGYLACVEYMDAQLGRVIKELDNLGLRDKTVIVFWGDHGYQLGEHDTWTKHTVWEDSCRVPLILSDPSGRGASRKTEALVELVDVYPTLAEMCGLTPPDDLEGTSLVPLLGNPGQSWKSAAFTDFRKNIPGKGRGIGRSIRTDQYRLIEWSAFNEPGNRVYELYDHLVDPGEMRNLATDLKYKATVTSLTQQLKSGWKFAKPVQ